MQQTSPMIGSKDALKGRIGSIDSSGLGSTRAIYNKAYEEEIELDEEEEMFVRDEIRSKISSMIFPDALSAKGLEPQRRDMNYLGSAQLIGEKVHTTTARDTIAPFSHRQLYPHGLDPVLGAGGADQAFRTTGNHEHIGSESGYVDPGSVMYDDNEPIYDIRDLDHPMWRAFKKHQNAIKSVLKEINECLSDN
jgi:hypothetical protein